MPETTALGAAMAAGNALDIWVMDNEDAQVVTDTFTALVGQKERDDRFRRWKEAVKRSMHWVPASNEEGSSKD